MREITLAATFSTLLIIGGHWFPWRALLHRDLHRLEAYIMGVLAIIAPAGVVLWMRGDWYALVLIVLCTIAAGIATVGAKAIDMRQRGVRKWGIKAALEVVRWQYTIRTNSDDFKINNNYAPYYARLIMLCEPMLDGFFEIRAMRGEE